MHRHKVEVNSFTKTEFLNIDSSFKAFKNAFRIGIPDRRFTLKKFVFDVELKKLAAVKIKKNCLILIFNSLGL